MTGTFTVGLRALRRTLAAPTRQQLRTFGTTPARHSTPKKTPTTPPPTTASTSSAPPSSYTRIRKILAADTASPSTAPTTTSPPPKATTYLSSLRPPPGSPLHTLLFSAKLHNTLTFLSLILLLFAAQAYNFLSSDPYAAIVRWSWWDPIGSVHRWWVAARMSVIAGSRHVGELRRMKREEKENVECFLRAHGMLPPLEVKEEGGDEGSPTGEGLQVEMPLVGDMQDARA